MHLEVGKCVVAPLVHSKWPTIHVHVYVDPNQSQKSRSRRWTTRHPACGSDASSALQSIHRKQSSRLFESPIWAELRISKHFKPLSIWVRDLLLHTFCHCIPELFLLNLPGFLLVLVLGLLWPWMWQGIIAWVTKCRMCCWLSLFFTISATTDFYRYMYITVRDVYAGDRKQFGCQFAMLDPRRHQTGTGRVPVCNEWTVCSLWTFAVRTVQTARAHQNHDLYSELRSDQMHARQCILL